MKQWQQLRDSLNTPRDFESLRVWGQPVAWADSVIHSWISDLIAEYVPQCISVADCFSGQWTDTVLQTNWSNSQMQIPVGPDCTPLLQLADIAVIGQAKHAASRQQQQLTLLLTQSASREGEQYSGKYGKFELWSVAQAMSSNQSKMQLQSDIVLRTLVRTQCLAVRPGQCGQLQDIATQEWSAQFPSNPPSSGLQPSWVESRLQWLDASPVPQVPDWDSLDTRVLSDDPFSDQPEESAVVIPVPAAVLAQLSSAEADSLAGPDHQWQSAQLPKQLARQRQRKFANSRSSRPSRWAAKLGRQWRSGRSLMWRQSGQSKPVPFLAAKKSRAVLDADREDTAAVKQKCRKSSGQPQRQLWKGGRKRPVAAPVPAPAASEQAVAPPAKKSVAEPVDHVLVGQQVRAVCESLAAGVIGQVYTVQSASQREGDPVELRLQSDRLAVRYATEAQVRPLSEEAVLRVAGPSEIDYRELNPTRRRGLAKSLSRDIFPVKHNELMESSSLQWGLAEIQYRLPVDDFLLMGVEESCSIRALSLVSQSEFEQLLSTRSRCEAVKTVVVVLHSVNPSHYTVLQRVRQSDNSIRVTYFDSLNPPSANAQLAAQQFCDKLVWGQCPVPSNLRYQVSGWECGIFSLQFVEEAVRQAREEGVLRKPVKVTQWIDRVNKFVKMLQPYLAVPPAAPVPPAGPVADLPVVAAQVASALEQCQPLEPVAVLADSLPPLPPPEAAPAVPSLPAAQPQMTYEQAVASAASCSKCRRQGCSHCMGSWFLPKSLLRGKSQVFQE